MLCPIMAGQKPSRSPRARMATACAALTPARPGRAPGDDRADDAHAGRPGDVGNDVMKLKIHLRHGLLHMLDMRGCGVQQAFALAQIGRNSQSRPSDESWRAQAIRVKPLQPLRIASRPSCDRDMLGVTCVDQNYLKPRSSSNSKIGIQ